MAGVRSRRLEWCKALNNEKVRPDGIIMTDAGARSSGWGKSRFRRRECVYRNSSHAWDGIAFTYIEKGCMAGACLIAIIKRKKKHGLWGLSRGLLLKS